jgi:DNA adenine methylase
MMQAKPFLKWAGGKKQLLSELELNFPPYILETKEIDLYVEPFVGGGALFFYLLSNYSVKKSIINDINQDLMLTYKVIKLFPEELIKKLDKIQTQYLKLNIEDRKKYFYEELRTPYNQLKVDYEREDKQTWTDKAALLIALNKTCFNGLYRQNSKGEFNVPVGRYKNPRILNEENLRDVSKLLQDTETLCGSYDAIEIPDSKKAFVYFDPPYRPLSTTSSFTKYSKGDFNDRDQEALAKYFRKLDKKGHYLLLSNSDPTNIDENDLFFDKLYEGYRIQRILAKRFINSDSSKRKAIREVLITNF